jgi:hypothetical protein
MRVYPALSCFQYLLNGMALIVKIQLSCNDKSIYCQSVSLKRVVSCVDERISTPESVVLQLPVK